MYLKIKRGIDILASCIGLVTLLPLFLILCVLVTLDSKGPIFFTQNRVGVNKSIFKIIKFRTMKIETPGEVPTHLLVNPDAYLTRLGRVLRKTSLDELPQLWNIFVGNMSLVGPRPALWNQCELIEIRDRYDANSVLPGLTGLAQVQGRDELSIEVKAKLDGEYVRNMSFLLDMKCILKTIGVVMKSEGFVEGAGHQRD
ncbi:sugar transferase [Cohnella sp. 56]|uniref:sugar transferase n=1 Tax=Cohnella sp. 56 TaxID=3113722 RepID=UPI0030EA4204